MLDRPLATLRRLWRSLATYVLKFGIVGVIGTLVDVGVYNALRVVDADALRAIGWVWITGSVGAKVASTAISMMVSWLGSRYWTFRHHRRQNAWLECFEYILVSLGGLVISTGCIWLSNDVFGWRSLVADNISGNVVGLGLAMIFRFVLYRYWIYGDHRSGKVVMAFTTAASERPDLIDVEESCEHPEHPTPAAPSRSLDRPTTTPVQ